MILGFSWYLCHSDMVNYAKKKLSFVLKKKNQLFQHTFFEHCTLMAHINLPFPILIVWLCTCFPYLMFYLKCLQNSYRDRRYVTTKHILCCNALLFIYTFFLMALVVCLSHMYLCDAETQTTYKGSDPPWDTFCRTVFFFHTAYFIYGLLYYSYIFYMNKLHYFYMIYCKVLQ